MGYIKDPEGVVLYVEHRQPTEEEDREVSEYIARYRAAHALPALPTRKSAPLPKRSPQQTPSRQKRQAHS